MASILVADDDEDIRELLAAILEDVGHDTVLVEDGVEALAEIERGVYDLVLIDNQMPRMTGLQVIEACAGRTGDGRPILVVISALASRSDVRRGYVAGADDFIAKPFSRDELLERVHALIDERQFFGASGQSGDEMPDASDMR